MLCVFGGGISKCNDIYFNTFNYLKVDGFAFFGHPVTGVCPGDLHRSEHRRFLGETGFAKMVFDFIYFDGNTIEPSQPMQLDIKVNYYYY